MTTNVRQLVRRLDGERVVLALALPTPAALLTLWGVLAVSILADPARPYTDGVWTTVDLISLGLLGGIVGLRSRPAAAAVGIPLGLAAAVESVQLYSLAAVVSCCPQVGSPLTGPEWTPAVIGARGLAIIRAGDRTGSVRPTVVALVAALGL